MLKERKFTFLLLLLGCIIGSLAIVPSVFSLLGKPLSEITGTKVLFLILQSAVVYSFIIAISMILADKVGFAISCFDKRERCNIKRDFFVPAIFGGLIAGSLIAILELTVFKSAVPANLIRKPGMLERFLAIFYGGINEEVLLRLFFLSFIVWILRKIFSQQTTPAIVWSGIFIATLFFGLGHMPMAAKIMPLTGLAVTRVLVLNGIAGVIFGWLYWRNDLVTAMLAHLITDIIIHVLLPALSVF